MLRIVLLSILLALAGGAFAQSSGSSAGDQGSSGANDRGSTSGRRQHKPLAEPKGNVPAGATARCKDDTYSTDKNRNKACAGHGGVAQWL